MTEETKTVKLNELLTDATADVIDMTANVDEHGQPDGTYTVQLELMTDPHVLGVTVWVGGPRLKALGLIEA